MLKTKFVSEYVQSVAQLPTKAGSLGDAHRISIMNLDENVDFEFSSLPTLFCCEYFPKLYHVKIHFHFDHPSNIHNIPNSDKPYRV